MKPKTKITAFEHKVYSLCKKIPKGKVSTYKLIAKSINSKAYRAVGNALNKNPYIQIVPCHRVIKSSGEIGGFAKGTNRKIQLLKKEGHKIKNGRLVRLSKSLIHPM